MAELAPPRLTFSGGCPDCGERRVHLPAPLPPVGDDFDWRGRDYDAFRRMMLEELAARFPERRRWSPADLEVVLVEVLATVLDRLSDMLDRVTGEAWLETARRPESVRRLLALVGHDAAALAVARGEIPDRPGESPAETTARLDAYWRSHPHRMEEARREGPRVAGRPGRMVTADDHARRLEEHPLVLRARAVTVWTGAWHTVRVAVVGWGRRPLDEVGPWPEDLRAAAAAFHREQALPAADLGAAAPPFPHPPTLRSVLRLYVDARRTAGRPVVLDNPVPVGIALALSVRLGPTFHRSEVARAVAEVLGTGPGGFFEPGRLSIGEDLYASELIQAVMGVDGVETVCLNRFQRLDGAHPDRADSGRIVLSDGELGICDGDPAIPERGYYRLTLHGGLSG